MAVMRSGADGLLLMGGEPTASSEAAPAAPAAAVTGTPLPSGEQAVRCSDLRARKEGVNVKQLSHAGVFFHHFPLNSGDYGKKRRPLNNDRSIVGWGLTFRTGRMRR